MLTLILASWMVSAPAVFPLYVAVPVAAKAAPKWIKCKNPKCPDVANAHEHLEPVKK